MDITFNKPSGSWSFETMGRFRFMEHGAAREGARLPVL